MKITFLGTGTSTGVPEIGCKCPVCTSNDPRDNRLRTSALIEVEGKRILIDCGPDFRYQMLRQEINELDAILITHEHYDHVGGLDDLRPLLKEKDIEIYLEENVAKAIETRMPYAFHEHKYPGVPDLKLMRITEKPFQAAGVSITPIRLMHARLPIIGFRIGNMAYLTDFKSIPEEEYYKLTNLDILVIEALRKGDHYSHGSLEDALANIECIRPKKAYLVHMSHRIGLHTEAEKELPDHICYAYDGLVITL